MRWLLDLGWPRLSNKIDNDADIEDNSHVVDLAGITPLNSIDSLEI